jgi:tRNA-dihydrouridine synthase
MNGGKIRAGGLVLANPLWLAPLAGITALPAREFFSRLGAGLTHTEMISSMGLLRGNRKTWEMLELEPPPGEFSSEEGGFPEGDFPQGGQAPVVAQFFSGDAGAMARGAEMVLTLDARRSRRFAALGINMACPMPKVTRRGAGAALMKTPETAFAMTRGLKRLGLPVWVKTRKADSEPETLRFIEGLAEAGADNICLHGRTPAQRYEGRADRAIAAAAARRFPGKISASGDVHTAGDVKEYLGMGCAGVMAARGALADPYLFPSALKALDYPVPSELADPSPEQRLARLRALAFQARALSGPRAAAALLKRLLGGMFKGMAGVSALRREAGSATNLDELLGYLNEGISRTGAGPGYSVPRDP